jgi:diaminohydroxyphosphoribosylaminopyrimidine deaminase / 5-amino-6-(5-phosphoribosylamino)uracil reductase
MTSQVDVTHMAHALRIAARGLGNTWPNPAVGCVLVRDDRIIGRGWTQPGGRPHAERMALEQAGVVAKGATAYVTLEPCAHHGQTSPCADALISAGVARVVTAMTDPDPRVAGRGHAMVRAAGIAVTENLLSAEAAQLNAGFLKRVVRGLPYVTLKLATSLDGRIATASGQSRWITGPEARREVHRMRLTHDAVMVGAGTARIDDPDLSVRDLGTTRQPVRIVLDSRLSLAPSSRLGQTAATTPVWMVHTTAADDTARAGWTATGAHLICVPTSVDGRIDATAALHALADRGLTRILCEGGGTLAAALLGASLVDTCAVFSAGLALGSDAQPAIGPFGLRSLSDAPRWTLQGTRRLGVDIMSVWSV